METFMDWTLKTYGKYDYPSGSVVYLLVKKESQI
jgi:hypothetical protein